VHASASRSTSSIDAGLGSNGPIVVSPFTSHCTCPGSTMRPAGNVVPRITRSTCSAIASSLPTPFCTEQTEPSANACATAAMAASVCMLFVATIPKPQGGSSEASLVARRHASSSPAPEILRPPSLMARTCASSRS
jgi:hypothetical protein